MIRATGSGEVVASCYGALDRIMLAAGEKLTVDSGHMVAYDDGVTMNLRRAASGGLTSMKSGEGFVFDFTGPGEVMVQSRNPSELITWLTGSCTGDPAIISSSVGSDSPPVPAGVLENDTY